MTSLWWYALFPLTPLLVGAAWWPALLWNNYWPTIVICGVMFSVATGAALLLLLDPILHPTTKRRR